MIFNFLSDHYNFKILDQVRIEPRIRLAGNEHEAEATTPPKRLGGVVDVVVVVVVGGRRLPSWHDSE